MTPGTNRRFWLWTRTIDVFSPGRGKRRINIRMQEMQKDLDAALKQNSELTSENKFLRTELQRITGENNLFRVQDEMNAAIRESAFTPPPPNLLFSSDAETTAPLQVVN